MLKKGKVISIKRIKVEKQEVYDLTIKDNHNYFADGLLVHNCDESQDLSDFALSNMLLPMISSSKVHKVVKIGVPRSKNHFYRSAMSKEGIYLIHDWLHCPHLLQGGVFEHKGVSGVITKYPQSVLDRMPYIKWQQYFPNNPELWRDPPTAMSEDDFETQQEMKWKVDSNTFLNEAEQAMLFGDFEFDQLGVEEYFFGLDIAGGKFIAKGKKNDRTELSIGRKRNGVTQKVACFTGDTVIPLLDGTNRTIADLSDNFKDPFWVYSFDVEANRIVPGLCNRAWKKGVVSQTVKITLDNNESFECTPDHLVLLKNGEYLRADNLKVNDSITPLYRQLCSHTDICDGKAWKSKRVFPYSDKKRKLYPSFFTSAIAEMT